MAIFIRADGNPQIGMGHIMRCLSIAEAIEDAGGEKPVFLSADDSCAGLIEGRGFELKTLGTDYRDMKSELPILEEIFMRVPQDGGLVLLVDSYQADREYFEMLRCISPRVHTACLEDMGEPYPVELLINYNVYAPRLKENYQIGGEPLASLLGADYIPLRRSFRESINGLNYRVKDNITDVMITTGGSDPHFAADAFVSAFLAAEHDIFHDRGNKITWHIVSGPFNPYAIELKEKYGGIANVRIYEGLKDLKPLIEQCDVVFTATGSTIYEVCAVGVPMIVFYYADNQRQGADELARITDIVNAGRFCADRDNSGTLKSAVEALRHCASERSYRERLHEQERRLVDGNGALRIAKALLARRLE